MDTDRNNELCAWCGAEFDDEEGEASAIVDGKPICDRCEKDEFGHYCDLCGDLFYRFDGDPHWISVAAPAPILHCDSNAALRPGVYRVVGYPYYSASMLGTGFLFYHHKLECVRALTLAERYGEHEYELGGECCPDCAKPGGSVNDYSEQIDTDDMPVCPLCGDVISDMDAPSVIVAHGWLALTHKYCDAPTNDGGEP